jgi:hypothetical protein
MDRPKRRQQRKTGERQELDKPHAEQRAALDAANRIREAAEHAYREEIVEDLGVVAFQRNGNIRVTATNAAEKKLAIKELRLKKKELTAQRRELTGRIMGAGVQAKPRGKRMNVDKVIVAIEQERDAIDNKKIAIDQTIARITASASGESD